MNNPSDQMVMGQGIRQYVSLNPFNYLRRAPRLRVSEERVFQSGVNLTDVSFYQKLIDFNKMKSAGAVGTIVRAGQNLWEDPYFDINWNAAKDATLPRGSYYFFDSRATPKGQADMYWSLIKNDVGELMVTADYEESYGGSYSGWRSLYDFTARLLGNGLSPEKLWIYTGYYYWLDHSPQSDPAALAYFKQFKLWIPWYTSNPAYVKIPKPWLPADVLLWQSGTPSVGYQYGVSTAEIDMNEWQGDLASYRSFWKLDGDPTPPPTGGNVFYGKIKTVTNVRDSMPGGTYRIIGLTYLQPGDLIEADKHLPDDTGVLWWHITKITRASANVPLPGAENWCWGTNVEEMAAPIGAPPKEVRVVMPDGNIWKATDFTKQ